MHGQASRILARDLHVLVLQQELVAVLAPVAEHGTVAVTPAGAAAARARAAGTSPV
jgi:hypothetical protein